MKNFNLIKSAEDFNQFIYGDGENHPPTIVFHSDAGHGWLQIPKHLMNRLGITKAISSYSYQDRNNVFLEEDYDLGLFLYAIGIGLTADTKELRKAFFESVPEQHADNRSFVRTLNRYSI
jgi:hypothetical protein